MPEPLAGRTVALPETRELDLLAGMLEQRGAVALRCPLVAILDAPDAGPIEGWLRSLVAGDFDDLILLTGEGLRRLLGFARRAGLYDDVVAAVARVRKVTRGPKPARALRELGLQPELPADFPTTEGVIATLAKHDLRGRRVAVQLYGEAPNPRLIDFLATAGATAHTVAPYVYAPASDAQRVVELIERMARGEVDVIAFTSASQVDRLWQVAREHQREEVLHEGLNRVRVAAVGPIVAAELRANGARVDISPAERYFMRPLVNEIAAAFGDAATE